MAGQEVVKDAISNFFCSKNTDVETFLKSKAIDFELRNRSRTYLIVDEQDLVKNRFYNIYGYFTIALKTLDLEKEVSNGKRKQLNGFTKSTSSVEGFLIGQLGKNDIHKTVFSGGILLEYALEAIMDAYKIVGGRFVLVELEDKQALKDFYKKNGFVYLQTQELIQMVRYLPIESE